MYAGWNLVIVVSILCGQSLGFIWPFTAFAATFADEDAPESTTKKVAIIGAGAGGAATAHYLQKFAIESGVEVDITVFERASYVGGRSTTVFAYNNPLAPVELGASIFVATNEILKNATIQFGLDTSDVGSDFDDVVGIWNGDTFVYTIKDSGWQWWDTSKMLWKYGLAPIKTYRLMKSVVGRFKQLYTPPFFPFKSLSDRSEDLDLLSATSMTGEQYLAKNGISGPFTTDIIQASTRVNYASNLGLIHGLETMVCMAIEGAMSVNGGNWQIFDAMLKGANATVFLNSTVSSIAKNKGKYSVQTTSVDASFQRSYKNNLFDTVVLAAPHQYSNIDIEEGLLDQTPDKIPYVTLHVTLFTSGHTFSRSFFGLGPDAEVPTTILTTLSPGEAPGQKEDSQVGKAGFFSISTLRTVINPETLEKEYLYKIFSPKPITSDFMAELFNTSMPRDLTKVTGDSGDAITWYYPHSWHSYPYEYPRVTFEDTALARGFYYTSGIDAFISTMETNALMGMNVAQLIVDDYLQVAQDEVDLSQQKVLQAGCREAEL